ncbi:hypothetical protein AT727_16220 [Desulfitobacterium hafniense]|uniref:Uncharacterized protein n=1 Tax=Desulfitobacterium hafniense TaxID=49338 RepID=A0A0W1JN28_DESHA|nr:hypothetical protein AT727_16220 [Desulfitobacterium hafniense]
MPRGCQNRLGAPAAIEFWQENDEAFSPETGVLHEDRRHLPRVVQNHQIQPQWSLTASLFFYRIFARY